MLASEFMHSMPTLYPINVFPLLKMKMIEGLVLTLSLDRAKTQWHLLLAYVVAGQRC